ncbi:MarR family winged helix-turn-helix transcriptional regulator [Azohydromonas caseinilytica]|uniref:MarR family transcriptional regulator n=1 Tax=Azohydromonas caseinilytica TaxID=2728836 RepID=A0A848FEN8_9BURK|nr:MarR family transcriptional regulator [Azohydromonas caseinilytica]NML18687.1 MarR family transcriptional regulator [Azohydromonas caseinilytica]
MPPRHDTEKKTPGIDQSCLQHLLGYQIARADITTRRAFSEHIGKPLELSPVEFSCLVLLAFNPGATPKQLATALAMVAPAVTVLLDRLDKRGLIERVRSDSDRRAQHVTLTPAGTELALKAHAQSLDMEREVVTALSAAERAILVELLQKVARAAQP